MSVHTAQLLNTQILAAGIPIAGVSIGNSSTRATGHRSLMPPLPLKIWLHGSRTVRR